MKMNKVPPITDLVSQYINETGFQSICTPRTMSRAPAWSEITRLPKSESIPELLKSLECNKGGMAIMCLLRFITGEHPEASEETPVAPGFMGTDVSKAASLWCDWGRRNGYLPTP